MWDYDTILLVFIATSLHTGAVYGVQVRNSSQQNRGLDNIHFDAALTWSKRYFNHHVIVFVIEFDSSKAALKDGLIVKGGDEAQGEGKSFGASTVK